MPAKNVIRDFTENSYYHVFNRGVEARNIFLDEQDYKIFEYYLLIYLLPLDNVLKIYPKLPIRLYSRNLSREVELISYCLMPNHFHLLLKQERKEAISILIKQLTNAYTFYFNNKYSRIGGLVQGRYKAIKISSDELLLHVSRYIHLNPVVAGIVGNPDDYKWSSCKNYFRRNNTSFVKTDLINSFFRSKEGYKDFVQDQIGYAKEIEKIKHLALEA